MKQKEKEPRVDYLVRVLNEFMQTKSGAGTISYDDAECDGGCLSYDISSEIDVLKRQRDELLAALKALAGHFLSDEDGTLPKDLYNSSFFTPDLKTVYEQVRAAISKAEAA